MVPLLYPYVPGTIEETIGYQVTWTIEHYLSAPPNLDQIVEDAGCVMTTVGLDGAIALAQRGGNLVVTFTMCLAPDVQDIETYAIQLKRIADQRLGAYSQAFQADALIRLTRPVVRRAFTR
jgi:hypothetical protein